MFKRAKILSYNAAQRTAQVHIHGLTDGAEQGLTATFAYPVGDDDRDTEREILAGQDVYVFFEDGDDASPVIAFYGSHGQGAVVDTRRIRQANVELLARTRAYIEAPSIHLKGNVVIDGNVQLNGNQSTSGNQTVSGNHTVSGTVKGSEVKAGSVSLKTHTHQYYDDGNPSTTMPPN